MKLKWHYTNDIHNYITVGSERFRLNTAYDNIFILLRALSDENLNNKLDAFFRIIIYKSDIDRFKEATKNWGIQEFVNLSTYIVHDVLHMRESDKNTTKTFDINMDAELIYASFYKEYNVSLVEKKGKMKWVEFMILLENLSEDTPMGNIIRIMNTDISKLSKAEKRIRSKRSRMLNKETDVQKQIDELVSVLHKSAVIKEAK